MYEELVVPLKTNDLFVPVAKVLLHVINIIIAKTRKNILFKKFFIIPSVIKIENSVEFITQKNCYDDFLIANITFYLCFERFDLHI